MPHIYSRHGKNIVRCVRCCTGAFMYQCKKLSSDKIYRRYVTGRGYFWLRSILCWSSLYLLPIPKMLQWKKLRICQTNLPGIINHNIFLGIFLQEYATSTFPKMHLICPPKFCITFVFISPGYYRRPKRNWKQCLCKLFEGQIRCIMGNVEVAYSIKIWKHWFTFFRVLVNVHPCRPVQQRTGNSSNAYI